MSSRQGTAGDTGTGRSAATGSGTDVEGMRADIVHHRDQRFDSYSGNLVHGGRRQNAKQRQRRLATWLRRNGLSVYDGPSGWSI